MKPEDEKVVSKNKEGTMHARTSLKKDSLPRRERPRLSLWPENQNGSPGKIASESGQSTIPLTNAMVTGGSEILLTEEEQRCCDMATD